MARQNGGLIGKRNVTSFGKCKVTSKTSNGTVTTQAKTRLVRTLVVAGGGSGYGQPGDNYYGGGGGAGGFRDISCISVCGSTPYPVTVGGGGSGGTAANNGNNSVAGFPSNPITSTGGGKGGVSNGDGVTAASPGGSGGGIGNWPSPIGPPGSQ